MAKFLKGMKVQVVANAGTSFDGLVGEVVQTQTNAADPVWVEFEGGLRTQMSTNLLFVPAQYAALATQLIEQASVKLVPIETVAKGEYVKLVRADKPTAKVYRVEGYDRSERKYAVTDCDDIWGNARYLKKGTLVYVGFTY